MEESLIKRHEPLYLKYRPQSLGQLVGQEGVKRTLTNAIEHNRLTHAYLCTGPRGTGKTSTARILAKSLNCKSAGGPTTNPCQTCSCCVEISNCSSPAVFEIDAASNNSVDDARQLIERAPLKAVGGEYKVYIIDECHMLTKEAFNALLKTIEQPPPQVVFILATTEEHKVIPTIVSRCQRLLFRLIDQDSLSQHLRFVSKKENIEIEDEAIDLIARRSGGGLRDALSNLDQASLLSAPGKPVAVSDLLKLLGALNEDVLLALSRQIAERSGLELMESIRVLLADGKEPQVVLQELAKHFLSLLKCSYLSASRPAELQELKTIVLGSDAYLGGLSGQCKFFELPELSQIIEQLDGLEQTVRRSSQPAMQLEIGLLSLCHRQDIHLLSQLALRVQALEARLAGGEDLSSVSRHASRLQDHEHASSGSRAGFSMGSSSANHLPEPQARTQPGYSSDSALTASSLKKEQADQQPASTEPNSALRGLETTEAEAENEDSRVQKNAAASPESASAGSGHRKVENEGDAQKAAQLNDDIEGFWQEVLDELKRRHLPTFSLTSTHAFPIGSDGKEITIGVMKESFQKMLETKSEHIKTACEAVSGLSLNIRIKVAEGKAQTPAKKPVQAVAARSRFDGQESTQAESVHAESESESTAPRQESKIKQNKSENPSQEAPRTPVEQNEGSKGESDPTMVKEAYRLFEGPGSRRIT